MFLEMIQAGTTNFLLPANVTCIELTLLKHFHEVSYVFSELIDTLKSGPSFIVRQDHPFILTV